MKNLTLLDRIVQQRRERFEERRRELLAKVKKSLDRLKSEIEFEDAYIFGSILKPYRFSSDSDIDVCFVGLRVEDFFKAWATLTEYLPYDDIQIFRIEEIDFKDRVIKGGIRWSKKD